MPRKCTICHHSDHQNINQELIQGIAFPAIAAKYSVSIDAIGRHKANHVPMQLVRAQEVETITRADDLLSHIAQLDADAKNVYEQAKRNGDWRNALAAVRERTRVIELLAKIKAELDERAQSKNNNFPGNINGLPPWPNAMEEARLSSMQMAQGNTDLVVDMVVEVESTV